MPQLMPLSWIFSGAMMFMLLMMLILMHSNMKVFTKFEKNKNLQMSKMIWCW